MKINTKEQWFRLIKQRALYAKEIADIISNRGLKDDAETLLSMLKTGNYTQSEILQSTAYQSVLRAVSI